MIILEVMEKTLKTIMEVMVKELGIKNEKRF